MDNLPNRNVLKLIFLSALVALPLLVVHGTAGSKAQEKPDQPGWHMWGPDANWRKEWRHRTMSPRHRYRMQRHWIFMNGDIPVQYQNLKNPHAGSAVAIATGQTLYTANCARCHGTEGLGEGEAGNDLYPSPALLAFMVQIPIAVDSYLMWTVSEGGKAISSKMPAFKETLTDDEIWQIITYMRNGFALP
ncbi:MAG: c-type cytochrome [Aestuariivirgaceae bacterium]